MLRLTFPNGIVSLVSFRLWAFSGYLYFLTTDWFVHVGIVFTLNSLIILKFVVILSFEKLGNEAGNEELFQ